MDEKLIDRTNWEEHYVKKGDPTKPTYYIIRRNSPTSGMFSLFRIFAGHIRYALSKGWLPVVDMQNYPNAYLSPEKFGKENSWEYFFEQPLRIGLEEAYNGENVILCEDLLFKRVAFPFQSVAFFENKNNVLTEWRMLVKLGLLKIKPEIMKEALEARKKLFAPTDRVLGVHLRGTDYLVLTTPGHALIPPNEYARDVIIKKIREWKCNKIFLATEDKKIVQFFKDTFVDGFDEFCIVFDKAFVNYDPKKRAITNNYIDRENDRFLQGKEYLIEILLLSMCNSFVTARVSGSVGVMLFANKFENVYAFDLGMYGVVPVDWRKLVGQ